MTPPCLLSCPLTFTSHTHHTIPHHTTPYTPHTTPHHSVLAVSSAIRKRVLDFLAIPASCVNRAFTSETNEANRKDTQQNMYIQYSTPHNTRPYHTTQHQTRAHHTRLTTPSSLLALEANVCTIQNQLMFHTFEPFGRSVNAEQSLLYKWCKS